MMRTPQLTTDDDDPVSGAIALMNSVAQQAETAAPISLRPAPELQSAIALLRAQGYRVSKPIARKKKQKIKDRVGPTFRAEFADGTVIRVSVFTSLERPDLECGRLMARHAWASRHHLPLTITSAELPDACPAIVAEHFEVDGKVITFAALKNGA
jgi:hypothetical protein